MRNHTSRATEHLPLTTLNKRSGAGFALIEGIVVLTILVLVASGAILLLRGQIAGNLDADAEAILSRLQEAQSKAAAGVDNKDWGIRFEAPTTNPHFYVMFSGNYATSSATTTFYLSRFVEFEDPAAGTAKEVIFQKLSGVPSTSTVIVIRLRSSPSEKRTIDISRLGRLKISALLAH
jgi:type II secretory pathway pseudopilin PulG